MVESFYDDLFRGKQSRDWVAFLAPIFDSLINPSPEKDFTKPPASAATAGPDDRYVGSYSSDLFGPLEVSAATDGLQIRIGPGGQTYRLYPYDGDQMWWRLTGEPPAAVTFAIGLDGKATSINLANFNEHQQFGTFVRT